MTSVAFRVHSKIRFLPPFVKNDDNVVSLLPPQWCGAATRATPKPTPTTTATKRTTASEATAFGELAVVDPIYRETTLLARLSFLLDPISV